MVKIVTQGHQIKVISCAPIYKAEGCKTNTLRKISIQYCLNRKILYLMKNMPILVKFIFMNHLISQPYQIDETNYYSTNNKI